jgi:hypothetical protein
MKKLLLLALATISIIATELPNTIETTIESSNNKTVQLSQSIPKGMSGTIIHDYGNGLSAITYAVVSQGDNHATLQPYSVLSHEKLPSIKTTVQKGDKVVFGNFYNNALLIAPNEQSYSKITKSINKSWIHPDIYASYLIGSDATKMTLLNLKTFAIKNQIGLVMIVSKESLLVLDPISGVYLAKEPLSITSKKAQSPFYARLEQIDTDLFSSTDVVEFPEYYQGIGQIK